MSKITPREYYICDYCNKKSDFPNFDYTDNSGINNKSYDMCSDKCLKKHIEFLKIRYFKDVESIEEHIEHFITGRNFRKLEEQEYEFIKRKL